MGSLKHRVKINQKRNSVRIYAHKAEKMITRDISGPQAAIKRTFGSQTSSAARLWHSASAKHRDLSLSTSALSLSSKKVRPSSAAKRPSRSAFSRAMELARAAFKAVSSWRSAAQSVSHTSHVASHCLATESRSYSMKNQNVNLFTLTNSVRIPDWRTCSLFKVRSRSHCTDWRVWVKSRFFFSSLWTASLLDRLDSSRRPCSKSKPR